MRSPLPRPGKGWFVAFAIVALVVAFYLWGRQPPGREKVGEDIVLGGELLDYEVWDGVPYVAFRSPDGLTIRRDFLRLDWISIEWPPRPAWQLSGNWFRAPATVSTPASLGVLQATPTEIFGEVNSPAITTIEVEYDGSWHAYPVESPGYLLRLDGFDGVPTAYRWLDAHGDVIHSRDRVEPIDPTR
jgi:hypothetical protein